MSHTLFQVLRDCSKDSNLYWFHSYVRFHNFIIIIIYSLRVFHISVSWWSFIGVWVTASLLKSPGQYSGWSQKCSSLDGLYSSSYFQVLQSCISPLVIVTRVSITIGITVTFMFHRFFQFPCKVKVLIFLFVFFQFYSGVHRDSKVHNLASFLFFLSFFLYLFIIIIIINTRAITWNLLKNKRFDFDKQIVFTQKHDLERSQKKKISCRFF